MIALKIISALCIIALAAYLITFFIKYKTVPPSLSLTAEYPGMYYWFQTTICIIFGFLQYYYPILYPFSEVGYTGMLLNAGCAGLALSGYFSYGPWKETKRDLFIHKVGSMIGGTMICLFYMLSCSHLVSVLIPIGVLCAVGLGLKIKGHGYERPVDNSVTFWIEMFIVLLITCDLVVHMF